MEPYSTLPFFPHLYEGDSYTPIAVHSPFLHTDDKISDRNTTVHYIL